MVSHRTSCGFSPWPSFFSLFLVISAVIVVIIIKTIILILLSLFNYPYLNSFPYSHSHPTGKGGGVSEWLCGILGY